MWLLLRHLSSSPADETRVPAANEGCLYFPPDVDVSSSSRPEAAQAEGFGKLYPSTQPSQQEDEPGDDQHHLPSDVISRKELEKGRLSRDGKQAVRVNEAPCPPTARITPLISSCPKAQKSASVK